MLKFKFSFVVLVSLSLIIPNVAAELVGVDSAIATDKIQRNGENTPPEVPELAEDSAHTGSGVTVLDFDSYIQKPLPFRERDTISPRRASINANYPVSYDSVTGQETIHEDISKQAYSIKQAEPYISTTRL